MENDVRPFIDCNIQKNSYHTALNWGPKFKKEKRKCIRRVRNWVFVRGMWNLQPEKCWYIAGGAGRTVVSAASHQQVSSHFHSNRQGLWHGWQKARSKPNPEIPSCSYAKQLYFTTSLAHLDVSWNIWQNAVFILGSHPHHWWFPWHLSIANNKNSNS